MAAANYPETPQKGDVIEGLPGKLEDGHVFHAGTTLNAEGKPVTSGGRVLCVTAFGENFKVAQKRAYDILAGIHFNGMQFRHDIGWRAIDRK
jgi:phosphoribosylamine--glycine ligase